MAVVEKCRHKDTCKVVVAVRDSAVFFFWPDGQQLSFHLHFQCRAGQESRGGPRGHAGLKPAAHGDLPASSYGQVTADGRQPISVAGI